MIKIENVQICGWEPTIRGMRNPLNSWAKSNSHWDYTFPSNEEENKKVVDKKWDNCYWIGSNDKDLMERLAKGGPCHAKYRRFITVYLDIVAPLYWWKEFETYKVGTDSNSCSTMHKIADKEFTLDDFSHEHLEEASERQLHSVILLMNYWRTVYLNGGMVDGLTEDGCPIVWDKKDKRAWWQMVQLLPSSYNQRRTIKLNYETLYRIYHDRKGHKLDEWNEFCKWIESLPLSEVITGPSIKDIPICNEIMEEAMRRIVDKFARENILSEVELKKILGIKSPSGKDDSHLIDLTSPEDDHPRYGILPGYSYEDLTDEEKKLLTNYEA